MERNNFPHLSDELWSYFEKLQCILGPKGVSHLVTQGAEAQIARIEQFMAYESALMAHMEGLVRTPQVPVSSTAHHGPKPLRLKVSSFEGKEGENLLFWIREVEVAMNAALIQSEGLKVAFAFSHLSGKAKSWALTRANSLHDAFPTWEYLQREMQVAFQPPNAVFRQRSRFLSCKQGKR